MNAVYSNYSPSFLYVDKYHFSDKWIFSDAICSYCMIRYICSGSAVFKINDEEYTVHKDDVFYIPQGTRLNCRALEEIVFISVRFYDSLQLPGENMLNYLWGIEQQYHCSDRPHVLKWFEEMYQFALSNVTYKKLRIRGYLNLICAELASMADKSEKTAAETMPLPEEMSLLDIDYLKKRAKKSTINFDPRIKTLVDYLVLHPELNITQTEMAAMINLSESSLRRLFKKEMGKTLGSYINDLKMQYATHLLVTSNESVTEIGYRLGYESISYFTKCFRENYGVSPREYRKNAKES